MPPACQHTIKHMHDYQHVNCGMSNTAVQTHTSFTHIAQPTQIDRHHEQQDTHSTHAMTVIMCYVAYTTQHVTHNSHPHIASHPTFTPDAVQHVQQHYTCTHSSHTHTANHPNITLDAVQHQYEFSSSTSSSLWWCM